MPRSTRRRFRRRSRRFTKRSVRRPRRQRRTVRRRYGRNVRRRRGWAGGRIIVPNTFDFKLTYREPLKIFNMAAGAAVVYYLYNLGDLYNFQTTVTPSIFPFFTELSQIWGRAKVMATKFNIQVTNVTNIQMVLGIWCTARPPTAVSWTILDEGATRINSPNHAHRLLQPNYLTTMSSVTLKKYVNHAALYGDKEWTTFGTTDNILPMVASPTSTMYAHVYLMTQTGANLAATTTFHYNMNATLWTRFFRRPLMEQS